MRDKELKKKVIWVVAIVIIISFGFLGTAYLVTDLNSANYAGKIFGKKIAYTDFEIAYAQVQAQAIMRYGDRFPEVKQFLDLETETWDRLILSNEAKKMKINIADQEVIKTIEEYPFFQRDGQFDTLLYNDILRFVFRMDARSFEESIRETIKFTKLFDQKTKDISFSQEEIFEEYQMQHEKIQVSYTLITPDQFIAETPFNEEEAKEYYNTNKLKFLIPPTVNVQYIKLAFPKKPAATSSEENADDETINDQLEEQKDLIRDKAETIYQELYDSNDLTALAQKHNIKLETSDYFSKEQPNLSMGWPFELINEIFDLDVGQISELSESNEGIFIAKLIDKKDTTIPDYAAAREKVKIAYLQIKAKDVASTKSEEYLKAISENINQTNAPDFAKAVQTLGLNVDQTPEFNRGLYLPKIGISKEFQDEAFGLTEDKKLSQVIETAQGYAILYLDSRIAASQEDFEKEKEATGEAVLNRKRNESITEYLTKLRLKANLQSNLISNETTN